MTPSPEPSVPGDAVLPPPPKAPAGPAPLRMAGSVRRTSSIDVDWPEGRSGPMRLVGRARDIRTRRSDAEMVPCGEDAFEAMLAPDRTIISIAVQPAREVLQAMVGQRAGNKLRGIIDTLLPEERRAGTPLHLLLDDISGTSLVAPWAWSRWDPDWLTSIAKMKADPKFAAQFNRENICAGLRTGSSGLNFGADGIATEDLRNPRDPGGWHAFTRQDGVGMRRARRIDVRIDDLIRIDAAFQDSATTPDGARSAVHEYRITAAADPVSLKLVALEAEPRVLPFAECPAAAANVSRLLGMTLPSLRDVVLQELRGTAGCTHLNDALRALAEVPVLARYVARDAPVAADG